MAINKPSNETKATIIRKSVKSLPNSPSREGYSAEAIKKAMYDFVTGDSNSVMSEIDRIVDEINEENTTQQSNNETSFASKMDKNNPTGTGTFSLTGDQVISGTSQASGFKIPGGTSSQFLKADGTKDSIPYQPANDNNLNTSFKNIVGAINEIKAGTDSAISSINSKIPDAASSSNKLVDTNTMNSSVSTATATFKGSFNLVSDLNLTITATEEQIATALATATSSEDNNDYAFVKIPTANDTPTLIDRTDRYKFNGSSWAYEYTLNTSGFTAAQWEALNSGITQDLVDTYITYEEVEELDPSIPAPLVTVVSNPNLFINGNFQVNQRNFATGTSGYTVDMWVLGGNGYCTATLNQDNTITLTNNTADQDTAYFIQRVSNTNKLIGKTLTMSFCDGDNTVHSLSGTIGSTIGRNYIEIALGPSNNRIGWFRLYMTSSSILEATFHLRRGKTLVVKWAKLELGSVVTAFCPKPYEEELAACQMPHNNQGISTVFSNPNLLLNADFAVNQRGITTMSGTNTGYLADMWQKGSVNSTVTLSGKDCTITIGAGSLAVIFAQTIELPNMVGKKLTCSMNITSSNIVTDYGTNVQLTYYNGSTYLSGSQVNLNNKTGFISFVVTVPANTTRLRFSISATGNSVANETITFDSPKLEVGEVATKFIAQPYDENLSICQVPHQGEGISTIYSNQNLLINGNFKINQRGFTTITQDASIIKYTYDRWQLPQSANTGTTHTASNNGLQITTTATGQFILRQFVEDYNALKGKTVTISVKYKSNTMGFYIFCHDGVNGYSSSATTASNGILTKTITLNENATQFYIALTANTQTGSVVIEWAKLEVGAVATPFSPRPYAEELTMCQRYYQIDRAYKTARNEYNFYEPYLLFKTEMRNNPTIVGIYAVSNAGVVSQNDKTYYDIAANAEVNATTNPYGYISKHGMVLSNGSGTFTANHSYYCQITLDAEIY